MTQTQSWQVDDGEATLTEIIPINVLAYGADKTGATDSTQAFIDAAATGRPVFVPFGQYRVDSAIAAEGSELVAFTLIGESRQHTGTTAAQTVIDLSNNTTYFAAVGYTPSISNITFKNGVDVFHHTSQNADANTVRLDNVTALQWTGIFWKGYNFGNGSHLSWSNMTFIANNETSSVFDNSALTGGTDSFFLTDSWVETKSDVTFQCRVGRINVNNTRFIPYTNTDAANSVWFNVEDGILCHFAVTNVDTGGESKRKLVNWYQDGGEIYLGDVGVAGNTSNVAINLIKSPAVITLNHIVSNQGPADTKVIDLDATMTAADRATFSTCKIYVNGVDTGTRQRIAGEGGDEAVLAQLAVSEVQEVVATKKASQLLAVGGPSWQSAGGGSGFSTVNNGPDAYGTSDQTVQITATSDASGFKFWDNGPGVSTIPDGQCTFEVLVEVENGPARFDLLFGSNGAGGTNSKVFHLGPGIHLCAFPLNWTSGMTHKMGAQWVMKSGVVVRMSRIRVIAGFHNSRQWYFLGSAAPTSTTTSERWQEGDVVKNTSFAVDVNNMILDRWVCSAAGSPGTWQPIYVSTVTPAT